MEENILYNMMIFITKIVTMHFVINFLPTELANILITRSIQKIKPRSLITVVLNQIF